MLKILIWKLLFSCPKEMKCGVLQFCLAQFSFFLSWEGKILGIGDFEKVGFTFWIRTPKINKISTWNFNVKLLDNSACNINLVCQNWITNIWEIEASIMYKHETEIRANGGAIRGDRHGSHEEIVTVDRESQWIAFCRHDFYLSECHASLTRAVSFANTRVQYKFSSPNVLFGLFFSENFIIFV